MLIKPAAIVVLGALALAVIGFEALLNITSLFNHGKVRLPSGLDRALRTLIARPNMHRVRQSIEHHETNSNLGFDLSVWGRLLGTYKDRPDAGHERMLIGIRGYRDPRLAVSLPGMPALPFFGKVSGYAINRWSWGKGR